MIFAIFGYRIITNAWSDERRVSAQNKAVLITGCDSGFGLAMARRFHRLGFKVFAGCLLKERGGDGARSLEEENSEQLHVLQLDVTNEEQIQNAVAYVNENTYEQGLWAVINNAGLSTFGCVEFCSIQTYKDVAEVTLWGVVRTTQAFLPLIRKQKGRVITMSSWLGLFSAGTRSTYCICKHGIETFSDCLRYEMKPWGVNVCLIEPANFVAATNIFTSESIKKISDKMWLEVDESVRADYGREKFDAVTDNMNQFRRTSHKDANMVIDRVEEVLLTEKPKDRYFVGNLKDQCQAIIRTYLPSGIGDLIYNL
ncbi:D-beta-hydroxybutyrate dehydrogenase, mitochondrial-like [Glandiceps talaboti]